ncbi:uncharacterized protein LOC124303147 isoform X1 [Neodiprion virginianus]|uniref:uncharacterized protein LOC124303147 isoform X1 n=1 Tax=Neodiprion virginianus TaxID=2961670 RepID=UPI001EE722B6|nr:uncharacterized protein LOC124303147 isoform X1 [Neodiprion virginianus]XP_046615980.1 uncharacterized protein LOC124303147 isoform X1 [Neodiprion virginianus]
MSYIQPQNSNRVNSIKQKFESASPSPERDNSSEKKRDDEKVKESLCRTLSASPVVLRKNLKLQVTRQLSNPGRNIKRSPAFRGDKLARTKNLHSPTKERIVSLVDKNVKLFEDKPEYGKLGKVKKKSRYNEHEMGYDDVDSIMLSDNLNRELHDNGGYGRLLPREKEKPKGSRSQSSERLGNREISPASRATNEQRIDSVRTTVISRHKNISAISEGIRDENDDSESPLDRHEIRKNNSTEVCLKLDKFTKNGVEYTKVMKPKHNQFNEQKTNNDVSTHKYSKDNDNEDYNDEICDIREELSRRKSKVRENDNESSPLASKNKLFGVASRHSKNSSEAGRIIDLFANSKDSPSAQTNLDFVPVKDIILRDKRHNLTSRKSSILGASPPMFENKLTDTLKAALKAPLPSGPPPKKPPRTFAHSPTTNRSPVDDYEEVNGFWQKKKFEINQSVGQNVSDTTAQKINSFLHDAGTQHLKRRNCVKNRKDTRFNYPNSGNIEHSDFPDQEKMPSVPQRVPTLDSLLYRIRGRSEESSDVIKDVDNSTDYEPIAVPDLNSENNISIPLSKLCIQSGKESDAEKSFSPSDSSPAREKSFPSTGALNDSASSEENSSSPLNISYSPKKFKTSPIRSFGSLNSRSRTSRDSKEMLEKLEHVLIQHQKACGPRVIVPRQDKTDLGITTSPKVKVEVEEDTENSNVTRHREIFQKTLSRTLEEGGRLGPLPNVPSAPERSRNLGFDCLPLLNCAGNSSIYEQIQNPDFKTYLTDTKNSRSNSLRRSENIYSKFGHAITHNSQFYVADSMENSLNFTNPDPYDTLLVSPASKRLSSELTTFSDAKKHVTNASNKEEHVYAEPFTFNKNFSTDITGLKSATSSPRVERRFGINKREDSPKSFPKGAELHYMCTPIPTACVETNNNHIENEFAMTNNRHENNVPKKSLLKLAILTRPSPDKFDKTKIEQLLDQAFGQPVMAGSQTPTDSNTSSDTDSLASSTSITEEYSTFSEKLQVFKEKQKPFRPSKAELHRSQTDKRKHYVRRVSSKFSERKEGPVVSKLVDNLFEVCLLVEINLSTRKPYVKDQYPIHAKPPAWIEYFCFPDGLDWPPLESDQNLAYTFVLTDEKGNRRYGHCRRVRPEGAPVCLPLAYCLITKHRASGFYAKLLDELESRHGQPDVARRNFIEQLYNSRMPEAGQVLRFKPIVTETEEDCDGSSSGADSPTFNNNVVLGNKFTNSYGQTRSIGMPKLTTAALLHHEKSKGTEDSLNDRESTNDEYTIVRLDDHRLEERDMSQLFDAVSVKVLLLLFASLLLERKVILICSKLSKLSSCVEALQSLLYPFNWPHPFVPILPNIPEFSEIPQAPSPFVIGILKQRNGITIEITPMEDGIIVDLDSSKVISAVGDESSILPSRLQKGLKSALQLVSNNTKTGDGSRNFLVSEAFLRVFVETCAHCDSHIVTQQDGKIVFEKESFVKAGPSRGTQYFLEWFVETTMFNQFIHDRILKMEGLNLPCVDHMKLFDQRVAEYSKAADKNSQSKKGFGKKKTLGDRFKDLTNFN